MVSATRPDKRPNAAQLSAEYATGDIIFPEGDPGDEMFIIEEGEVAIFKVGTGVEQVLVTLERGDFFGEMAMLEDEPRSSGARAATPVRLLRINRQLFDEMLRQNPQVAVRMMRKLSRRVRELEAAAKSEHARAQAQVSAAESVATESARLVHDSGVEFALAAGRDSSVGRFDRVTGAAPTVDLQNVDTMHAVSRRHAVIRRDGAAFKLIEEIGTSNGTFLNGVRLTTGVAAELHDGDRIRFASVDVTFRAE